MPAGGPGSAAATWRRASAFFVDVALAALVAGLFTLPDWPRNWSLLVWVLITVIPVSFAGFTPGMALLRIWVARVDGKMMVGPLRALLRCALTALIIPTLTWNVDGRAWHDRLSGTVVLRR